MPISGMRRVERIKENFGPSKVMLTDEKFHPIEIELAQVKIYGNRTGEDIAKLQNMN